jgi:hypothetical protein
MTTWTVCVEWTSKAALGDEQLDTLTRQLEPLATSAQIEPGDTPSALLELDARTVRQAFDGAVRAVETACRAAGLSCTVTGVEVLTREEYQRRQANPAIPPLVGLTEIAEMADVTRQRAKALTKTYSDRLPQVAGSESRPLFLRAHVEDFLRSWTRQTGRPPKRAQASR